MSSMMASFRSGISGLGLNHAAALPLLGLAVLAMFAAYASRPLYRKRHPVSGRYPVDNQHASPDLKIEPLVDFDWRTKEPERFRPFKDTYHITMALQSTTPSDLVEMDKNYLERVNTRQEILRQHESTVLGHIKEGDAPIRELHSYILRDYLPSRFPTMFAIKDSAGQRVLHNRVTGQMIPLAPSGDPAANLKALAMAIEDDVFLLKRTPQGHLCVAFLCCFPAGFDPSAKLAKVLEGVHQPVPSYRKIGASMERVFGKLAVGRSFKRMNWSVQTSNDLFHCQNHPTPESAVEDAQQPVDISQTNLRVELQTLTRLPKTHSVLFSFKTYMYPIADVKAEGLGPDLIKAIHGLDKGNAPGMRSYKGAARWGEPLCEYLRD